MFMDADEARQFLRENHNAVVTTIRKNGDPAMSPISVGVDNEGYAVISSRETAYKVKHLERDPRVWLTCLTKQFYGEWLSIKGTATVVHLPDAMDGLIDYYRGISGEHPDWDDYRAAMVRDQRVLIKLALTRAGPDAAG